MKAAILAGAVAALLYGPAARAGDCDKTAPSNDTQASLSTPERSLDTSASAATDRTADTASNAKVAVNEGVQAGNEGASTLAAADTQAGVGGSGDLGVETQSGTGGSGSTQADPCVPATGGSGTTGSTTTSTTTQSTDAAVGGSGQPADRPVVPPPPPPAPVVQTPSETPFTGTETDLQPYQPKREDDMRGLTVTLGGGVEGYTQALAPAVSPGPSVAVNALLRPSKVLGIELGYSGAVNEIKQEDNVDGADFVRNGGQAAITLGLNAASVQPYVLGGIGVSSYNVRDENSARFQDDTVGNVPVGAGLRTHFGNFTADARVGYSFLFDQEFARAVETADVSAGDVEFSNTGRYNATLNFGLTF